MDLTTLTLAISQHAWAVVTGCVLLAIVSTGQLPAAKAQWDRLPAAARPFVPVALGIASGVAQALVARQPWAAALVANVLVALPSVLAALPSQVIRRQPDPANPPNTGA